MQMQADGVSRRDLLSGIAGAAVVAAPALANADVEYANVPFLGGSDQVMPKAALCTYLHDIDRNFFIQTLFYGICYMRTGRTGQSWSDGSLLTSTLMRYSIGGRQQRQHPRVHQVPGHVPQDCWRHRQDG